MTRPPPSWHWPDTKAARVYFHYVFVVGVLFFAGYGGANWLGAQRAAALRLYLPAELAIPLVPAMILPYCSINLLFVLPLFRLERARLRLLGRAMTVATLVATACFLAAPTALGFAPVDEATGFAPLYRFFDQVQYPYNCAPSLHVAYSSLIVLALIDGGSRRLCLGLVLWLGLVVASTVLAHQHQLIDVAGGLVLAAFARLATAPRPNPRSAPGATPQPAGSES